ncbi:alpha/beta hydrolase [Microbulbifer hainanensis]|uniref:alpha/beta hydrolase n=1 Tax=Microbulbifer hainanensis TaxID=2735675 RepID=UPI001868413C|nr:alpha/beta hydrolase [Microbulbifer hainanensis]
MEFVSRGNRLHYRRWWVEGALGVVVISHGLGEHSGRYRALARYLNAAGFSVYALDHFGHGLSEGKRGHIDDFAHFSEDLYHFLRLVRRDLDGERRADGGRQIHLLGHSMGGVIAAGCAIRFGGMESLILSAPGFRGGAEPSAVERWLVHRLAVVAPRLSLPNRIDPHWLSRDPAVVADYCADDLVHNRVTLQWFVAFLREREFLRARLEQITVPCLVLLPEGDLAVDPETTRAWFDHLGSDAKRLHSFAGAYHELFNEVEEGPVARELLLQHLKAQLPLPAAATG